MKKHLHKERKLLDADITVWELFSHSLVNFLYGLFSGLTIAAVTVGSPIVILISYYCLKQVEGKILNRHKYTTKLGKNIIFPIPSTIGFYLGWKISTCI